mgnify:CR=1 FL=1
MIYYKLSINMNLKKLDIKQWESAIVILLKNMSETKEVSLHIEDIAIKVKEIFPSFFSWSKYKNQIDLRQVMRTMDKLSTDGYVIGSNPTNWTLTKKGINYATSKFLNENMTIDKIDFSRVEKDIRSNNDFYKREIIRIQNSDVFKKYLKDGNFYHCTDIELKYLIKKDHYSDEKRVIKNISSLYISVQQNQKLTTFLNKYLNELSNRKIINKDIKLKVENINE